MCDGRSSLLVRLYTVEGACNRAPFYHIFRGFAGFCAISRVFGWASLRDNGYRGVLDKSGCVVGVDGVGWCRIGSCGERWSGALGASFDGDLYGLSSCGCCARRMTRKKWRCYQWTRRSTRRCTPLQCWILTQEGGQINAKVAGVTEEGRNPAHGGTTKTIVFSSASRRSSRKHRQEGTKQGDYGRNLLKATHGGNCRGAYDAYGCRNKEFLHTSDVGPYQ